jgi:hypothetical protein
MDAVVRYRAAVVMGVLVLVVVLAVTFGKGSKNGSGSGGNGIPKVEFGAQPPRLGTNAQLTYTNGWAASVGTQTIAVYAGREAANPRNGLLVIARRTGRRLRRTSVTVRGSGALTLLRPAAPASEQAAFGETLPFVTASGATGTLALNGDGVKLSG